MAEKHWIRYRFHANAEDWRPVTFPPPGPYWCSGEAGDGSYAIIVAYLPSGVPLPDFWPEADQVTSQRARGGIVYSSRFPKPDWFTDEAASRLTPGAGA